MWRGRQTDCAPLSVLKSNGLRHSKNLPVKFGFSPKTVPANIARKLPSQRCSKPLFIAFFNFSHKRPTFAFTPESGYTLGSAQRIAHNGSHGETEAFPPPATAWSCAASGIVTERIAGESGCTPYGVCPLPPAPQPRRAAQHSFRSAYVVFFTLGARGFLRVRSGGGITTLGVLRILSKLPVPACQND